MKWLTEWALVSGVLILIVLAVRRLFRDKLSARLKYALWLVVLARLLVPFQVKLPANISVPLLASNLAPDVDQWMDSTAIYANPVAFYPVGWKPGDEGASGKMPDAGLASSDYVPALIVLDDEGTTYYDFELSKGEVLFLIWAAGAGTAALVILVSNLRFYRKLRKHRKPLECPDTSARVYTAEGLPSPCLFGVFRPSVYVTPEAADNPDVLRHVLAHELTHYKHKDHIWSLLRCLALALHWYNPLAWLAAALSKEDGELACDEGAVARLGEEERIPYGRTLVDMVAARSARPVDLLSCSTAMTGGKKSIQQRVARLVKKPETVKTALFAAVSVVALSVVFVFARRGTDNTPNMLFDYLSRTTEIHYSQPLYSNTFPIGTSITDEDLLAEAKEVLSTFTILSDDDPQPDLTPREAAHEHYVTLIFEGGQMKYSLLWQNDRTYLFPGSIWQQSLDLKQEKGETAQLLGVSGTCISEANVISALSDLARQQRKLERAALFGLDRFRSELEAAQSIFVGNPSISSQSPPPAITDPTALAQAKDILSNPMPVVKEDDTWRVMSLSSDSAKHPEPITQDELEHQFLIWGYRLNLYPTAEHDLDTADRYFLIPWDNYCLLTQWYPEREENTVEVVAALPGNTINRLRALVRQQAAPAEPDTPAGQEDSDQQHTPAEPVRYQIDDAGRCAQLSQLFLGDEECKAMNDTSEHEMEDWLTNWTSFYKVYYGPPYLTSVGTEPGWYAHAVDAGSFYFIQIPDHLVPQVLAICQSPAS